LVKLERKQRLSALLYLTVYFLTSPYWEGCHPMKDILQATHSSGFLIKKLEGVTLSWFYHLPTPH
jgi:hypothetical protein